jgi:hypothetical protein
MTEATVSSNEPVEQSTDMHTLVQAIARSLVDAPDLVTWRPSPKETRRSYDCASVPVISEK